MSACYHGDSTVSTTPSAKELLAGFANKIFRQLTDLDKHYDFGAQRPLLERFIARYLPASRQKITQSPETK